MRLSAGLRPDPLGSLQKSPGPLAGLAEGTRKGRRRVEGKGIGEGRRGEKRWWKEDPIAKHLGAYGTAKI